MKFARLWIILAIVVMLASSAAAQGKPADESIKVTTALVSVPVIVSDRNGRFIPNLSALDFKVFQDGVPQNIEFFGAAEEPITVAILIDTSQSTGPILGEIKKSARAFIQLLRPKDRATIVSFDWNYRVLSPLTSDHNQLNTGLSSARIGEFLGTQLRDSVLRAVTRDFRQLTGRKAIILLTDGQDATSQTTTSELMYALQETDTLIYTVMFKAPQTGIQSILLPRPTRTIIIGGSSDSFPPQLRMPIPNARYIAKQNAIAEDLLHMLSDTTAGRFYSSNDLYLKKTFEAILNELRFQYRIGFYPPEDNGEKTLHQLKVKVTKPDAVVRARGSYRTQTKSN